MNRGLFCSPKKPDFNRWPRMLSKYRILTEHQQTREMMEYGKRLTVSHQILDYLSKHGYVLKHSCQEKLDHKPYAGSLPHSNNLVIICKRPQFSQVSNILASLLPLPKTNIHCHSTSIAQDAKILQTLILCSVALLPHSLFRTLSGDAQLSSSTINTKTIEPGVPFELTWYAFDNASTMPELNSE